MLNIELVLKGYVDAALWSTLDDPDEPGRENLDDNYGFGDVELETLCRMRETCRKFCEENEALLIEENLHKTLREATFEEYVGHDLWLTQNGHGCGFWDGDWDSAVGEVLSEKAHAFGEVYLFANGGQVDDDRSNGETPAGMYQVVGYTREGNRGVLGEFPNRAYAYATATKWTIDVRVSGNWMNLKRLEVCDHDGVPLTEYAGDNLLTV